MKTDFALTIKWEQEARGRREVEDAVFALLERLVPTLDDSLGRQGWSFEWSADVSRARAEHNAKILTDGS
jgi:hypothetical protein